MKLRIVEEVATLEEASPVDDSQEDPCSRYGIWPNGEIMACTSRSRSAVKWLKLTTLDGEPEAVAQMLEHVAAKIRSDAGIGAAQ